MTIKIADERGCFGFSNDRPHTYRTYEVQYLLDRAQRGWGSGGLPPYIPNLGSPQFKSIGFQPQLFVQALHLIRVTPHHSFTSPERPESTQSGQYISPPPCDTGSGHFKLYSFSVVVVIIPLKKIIDLWFMKTIF